LHYTTYASAALSATHSIIDELTDRDRRKRNVIIYNFPEAKDRTDDKNSFLTLCRTVFDLNAPVTQVLRLGKRFENKFRPLLVCFEEEDDKSNVISHSNWLCRHDQYKRVFIAPDRTKFEREKYTKLVNELKERKARGETNLIIRNGCMVSTYILEHEKLDPQTH